MRRRGVVADDAFEGLDGAGEVAVAHLLVAERDAEEGLARLEGEAFFDLIGGELELVLVLVDAGAVVVDDRRRWRG